MASARGGRAVAPLPHPARGQRDHLPRDLPADERGRTLLALQRRRDGGPGRPRGRRINLTIDAASLDTGIEMRDKHLRSSDFFDMGRFPTIVFQSVRVEAAGRRATVIGRLTCTG